MYDAHNMYGFLGDQASDDDAQKFASFLNSQGWELIIGSDGLFSAYRDSEAMEEHEWQEALRACFG